MGQSLFTDEKDVQDDAPTDQIFRSANTAKRRAWLKSTDLLDVRLATSQVEEMFAQTYYAAYLDQCAVKRDPSELFPNEEFQMAVDTLEENPAAHAAELESVAQRHLHDIVDIVGSIVDDYDGEIFTPVHVSAGVGRAYSERGFFFFVWDSYIGEKFGRLELRNCRRLMELQMMSVHVPLTYHLIYKGRGCTVQSLTPVSHTTRIFESSSTELQCICREICAALCLSEYDEDRTPFFLSNMNQAHIGRDGRLYFLQNSYWSVPWLSSKGERSSPEQRFSCLRNELLITRGSPVSCRAFQANAMASENASCVMIMRRLLDISLHEVPKVLGSISDTSTDSIIVRFRKLGFNFSMLGWLLLSLFRNVSPPEKAVRAVLTEMFIRGIKQFIMWRSQPVFRMQRGRPHSKMDPRGLSNGEDRGDDDEADFDFDAIMHAMDAASSSNFIDTVQVVLRAFLEYQGAHQPRPATALHPPVPAPMDLFGSEVVPHIYKKFRLLPEDVDLYGKMDDEQKLTIYTRVAASLGVTIQDGRVARTFPVVLQPGVPRTFLPSWVLRRTDNLVRKLLRKQATRADWVRFGPALIPLLRLQPQCHPFYPQLEKVLTTLQQPEFLTIHVQQHCFSLASLQTVIFRRELLSEQKSSLDRHVLVQLHRKRAFAYYDEGRSLDAADHMRQALVHSEAMLEICGNHYSSQFRRCTSELVHYLGSTDLVIEKNMIRLISRYCEPDVLIADDFLQLAVTKLSTTAGRPNVVDEMELEWDLSRAIRIYAERLGDQHPKTVRAMANLAILWYDAGREDDAKVVLQSLCLESPDCPLDVRELVFRLENPKAWGGGVLMIPPSVAAQPHAEFLPLMFVLHTPKFAV